MATLPDFGPQWNEHVVNYANLVAMTAPGWKWCSFYELDRYSIGGWAPSPGFLVTEDGFRQRAAATKS